MKESELKKIEQNLDIKLPNSYKKVIFDNPFGDKEKFNMVYCSLLDDVSEILKINLEVRDNGFHGKEWPNNYYIFGYTKSAKSYLFINVDGKINDKIYIVGLEDTYNPKKIGHLKHADSFDVFIKHAKMVQSVA